jgi:ribosomal protein S18 acetylase RimI-like enzyme
MSIRLRPYEKGDLDALYDIALRTGDGGADASPIYQQKRLVGDIYAAPYVLFHPETAFIAEDAAGLGGYFVGAPDTAAFEARLEAQWWPGLRGRYGDPLLRVGADRNLLRVIFHPPRAPADLVGRYPAHLHINLLPRLQGAGVGRDLMSLGLEALRGQGAPGVHLGVDPRNSRALRFYRAGGWREPDLGRPPAPGVIWLARRF